MAVHQLRFNRGAAVLAATALAALLIPQGSAPAVGSAEAAAPSAKLAVVGTDVIEVELTDFAVEDSDEELRKGIVTVLLSNTGNAAATVHTSAQEDVRSDTCSEVAASAEPTEVAANQVTPLKVTFDVSDGCDDEAGTLVFQTDDASTAPATSRFKFVRSVASIKYWIPVAISLGLAGLLAAILVVTGTRGRSNFDLGSAWSFKDSWLTNVTALTALLGTLLASTGLLDQLLPGIDSGWLLGMNLLFGGLVLLAPVLYSALAAHHWKPNDKGSYDSVTLGSPGGLVTASSVSLAGATGMIATIGLMVAASDVPTLYVKTPLIAGLSVTGLLVFLYALRWTRGVITETGDTLEKHPGSQDAVESIETGAVGKHAGN